MAKTKEIKPSKEIESLWKAFKEDYDDNELQVRYNGFKKNLESLKEKYNGLVPNVNDALKDQSILKEQIIDSAKMGFLNNDSVKRLKIVENYLNDNLPEINRYQELIQKEEAIIKKYEDGSHDRLFGWWKALKTVDSTIKPWIEFKTEWGNKII